RPTLAGVAPVVRRHCLAATGQARQQPACREWGLRPQAPPSHYNGRWRFACTNNAMVAGRVLRVCGRRPHSRHAEPVPAWPVLTRQHRRTKLLARERGPQNAGPQRPPR
ncbi:MAG TPA: hypothetical protein PLB41_18700, partial [Rubrivivax sp.]|nr:hypothetical protein [Rubrivivax sp.]